MTGVVTFCFLMSTCIIFSTHIFAQLTPPEVYAGPCACANVCASVCTTGDRSLFVSKLYERNLTTEMTGLDACTRILVKHQKSQRPAYYVFDRKGIFSTLSAQNVLLKLIE